MSGDLKRKRDEEQDGPNKRRKLDDGVELTGNDIPIADEISIPTITQDETLDGGTLDSLDINLDLDPSSLTETNLHQEEDVSVLVRRKIKMSSLVKAPTEIIDDVVNIEDNLEFQVEAEPVVYKDHTDDSEFKHLHWSGVWKCWVGVCENDGDYDFVFDKEQLPCAEKLNLVCQEKNLRLLNAVSVRESPSNSEWQTTDFNQVYLHPTSGYYCALFESCQASSQVGAEHVASRLNARCAQKNLSFPNPTVEPEFTKTDYTDVYYLSGAKTWVGQCTDGQGNTKRDTNDQAIEYRSTVSAADAAAQLNQLCASLGLPLPNQLPKQNDIDQTQLQTSMYNQIFWYPNNSTFVGMVQSAGIQVFDVDDKVCAMKLNRACRTAGVPLPNSSLPCYEDIPVSPPVETQVTVAQPQEPMVPVVAPPVKPEPQQPPPSLPPQPVIVNQPQQSAPQSPPPMQPSLPPVIQQQVPVQSPPQSSVQPPPQPPVSSSSSTSTSALNLPPVPSDMPNVMEQPKAPAKIVPASTNPLANATQPSPLPTAAGSVITATVSSRRQAMLKMLGKTSSPSEQPPSRQETETHVKKSPSPPPYNSAAFYDTPPTGFHDNISSYNPMQDFGYNGYNAYGYNGGYFQPVQQRTSRIMDQFPLGSSQWGNFAIPEKRQRRKKQRRSSSRLVDPSMPRKKSKFKGVYWETRDQKWRARIYFEGRRLSGGSYVNEREAALAVNRLCQQLGMEVKNPELDSIRLADEDPYIASRRAGLGRPSVKSEYGTPRDVLAEPSSRIRSSGPVMGGDSYYGNIQVKQEPRYGGFTDSLAGGWS